MSDSKIKKIKTKIIPLAKASNMTYVGLFGSYARGDENEKSDIDLLVQFLKPITLIEFIQIENKLSKALNRKVDLVTEKALSPYLKPYVIKDLKVLYERG